MIIWGNKEVQQEAKVIAKARLGGVLYVHGMPCHAGSKLHKMQNVLHYTNVHHYTKLSPLQREQTVSATDLQGCSFSSCNTRYP